MGEGRGKGERGRGGKEGGKGKEEGGRRKEQEKDRGGRTEKQVSLVLRNARIEYINTLHCPRLAHHTTFDETEYRS